MTYSFIVSVSTICFAGNAQQEGASLEISRKTYKSSNKSMMITHLYHSNMFLSAARCLPLLTPSLQFTGLIPRYFSSQNNNGDGDDNGDVDDSVAVADYYRLYERLMTQLPVTSSPSASSVSSCSEFSRDVNTTLSHVGDSGKVKMVDVGSKSETSRVASATGRVQLGGTAFQLVAENRLKKGDVLSTAQLAGIMAAKQTYRLIPLCHNIVLASVDVSLTLDSSSLSVVINCTAKCRGQTGVQMEALTGVSVAALTVYDMCKSVSHDIIISDIQLTSKTGGKSDFCRH